MISTLIDYAKALGLTQWDWAAIVVSTLSFTTSIISIHIAFKTMRSQEKTQNNTALLLSQNAGFEYQILRMQERKKHLRLLENC